MGKNKDIKKESPVIKENEKVRENMEIVMDLLRKYSSFKHDALREEEDVSYKWNTMDIFEEVEEASIKEKDVLRLRRAFMESEDALFHMKRTLEWMVDDMEVCLELKLHKDIYKGLDAIDESVKILRQYI